MRTNHVNIADQIGQVYCFHVDKVVDFTQDFLDVECRRCPYFGSDSFGNGVECSFDDGSRRPEIAFFTPADSEKWSKYVEVRLGLKTREEIDGMLKLTSTLETPEELALPAHLTAPIEATGDADLEAELAYQESISRKNASVSEALLGINKMPGEGQGNG